MDERQCRAAVETAAPGRDFGPIRLLEGGWSFWTFRAGRHIVRFPRTPEDAAALRREFRLLPALAERLEVPVPAYDVTGEWDGSPFGAYPALAGEPVDPAELRRTDSPLARQLGHLLRALHQFPPAAAIDILRDSGLDGWEHTSAFLDECRQRAFPLLDPRIRALAEREIARMDKWIRADGEPFALVHNDLGLCHVLVDHGRIIGVIDWTDAALNDPAIDFVGIVAEAGWEGVTRVLEAYGPPLDDGFRARIGFYAWVAPLHDILYGLRTGQDAITAEGVAGVRRRMRLAGLVDG